MSTETVGVTEALNCVYNDLLLLRDEEWEPDVASVEASLDMISIVAEALFIELTDDREEP